MAKTININDFDYPLPDERIAKFPLERRDGSKLLVYRNGEITERRFADIGSDRSRFFEFGSAGKISADSFVDRKNSFRIIPSSCILYESSGL